ncbi:protein of unknown function [Burkholderia multivorans]
MVLVHSISLLILYVAHGCLPWGISQKSFYNSDAFFIERDVGIL